MIIHKLVFRNFQQKKIRLIQYSSQPPIKYLNDLIGKIFIHRLEFFYV